jgi:hypothetical protein
MAYLKCGGGGGTPTITRIAKVDSATASSSSQPGKIYTKTGLDPNKQYIVVATGTSNCSNSDGYIAIDSSSNRIYIPTFSNSQSITNATISSVITGASSTSVLLGWVNSHSSVYFKYSVTIYEVA